MFDGDDDAAVNDVSIGGVAVIDAAVDDADDADDAVDADDVAAGAAVDDDVVVAADVSVDVLRLPRLISLISCHRCPVWLLCSKKWMAIPGLPGVLLIYQGNPSISPRRTPMFLTRMSHAGLRPGLPDAVGGPRPRWDGAP